MTSGKQTGKVDIVQLSGFIHFSGQPASFQLDHCFSPLQSQPLARIKGNKQPKSRTYTDG